MIDLSEMNATVKGIYTNPFIRENWEYFASMVSDLKKEKLQINLIVDTTPSIDIGYLEQLNIKEFKKAALSLQAFELVAILRDLENGSDTEILSKQYIRDTYFSISENDSSISDFIVPNNEFINFFIRNCIESRLPNYNLIFNYLR